MRVNIAATRDTDGGLLSTRLVLSLTLVLRPPAAAAAASARRGSAVGRPAPRPRSYSSWQLGRLLGSHLRGVCPVATASRLLVQLPPQVAASGSEVVLRPPPVATGEGFGASSQEGSAGGQQQAEAAAAAPEGDTGAGAEPAAAAAGPAAAGVAGLSTGDERLVEWETSAFKLSPVPDGILLGSAANVKGIGGAAAGAAAATAFYAYDLRRLEREVRRREAAAAGGREGPVLLEVGQVWKQYVYKGALVTQQPDLQVTRYTTGAGFMNGGIVLRLAATSGTSSGAQQAATTGGSTGGTNHTVCIFQMVPWYVRVWLHTLRLKIDGAPAVLDELLILRHISPAADRQRPLVLDLCLELPVGAREAVLTFEFSKAFLHVFEWPPDAHRGFDVPAAVVSYVPLVGGPGGAAPAFGGGHSGWVWRGFGQQHEGESPGAAAEGAPVQALLTPLLRELLEPRVQQLYSEGLLVPLAPPDFSMPYNVVCLTSTVLAVYIGATLNALLRRPGEELRLAAKGTSARAARLKVVKVVAVVVIFGGLAVYVDDSLQEPVSKALVSMGLPPLVNSTVPQH